MAALLAAEAGTKTAVHDRVSARARLRDSLAVQRSVTSARFILRSPSEAMPRAHIAAGLTQLSLGMRQGEVLGLEWDADLDLEDGWIDISHQLQPRPLEHGCPAGSTCRASKRGDVGVERGTRQRVSM